MAGTITVSTISDGTNSTSSTNCIQGSAKAWVNFNGTAATVTRAYNVSSITKAAAGQYTANLTTAFPTANPCVVGSVSGYGNLASTFNVIGGTASNMNCSTINNGAFADNTYVTLAGFC